MITVANGAEEGAGGDGREGSTDATVDTCATLDIERGGAEGVGLIVVAVDFADCPGANCVEEVTAAANAGCAALQGEVHVGRGDDFVFGDQVGRGYTIYAAAEGQLLGVEFGH